MKKFILLFIIVALYLIFPAPAVSDTFYLILLKNGGRLATPMYWIEGTQLYFFYLGGTVGIDKNETAKIEKYERKINYSLDTTSEDRGNKELPPLPSAAEKSPGPEKPPVAKIMEEKVDIAGYKNKKDRLEVELENLLDKRREAGQRKDKESREKLTEEIKKTSAEIYGITDEVTAKNKGKLPEGWWKK